MKDLVPIKVTLRRTNADGSPRLDQHGRPTVYPSFRDLSDTDLKGRKPHDIINEDGIGFMINKAENLGTGAAYGEAIALVPPAFAKAVVGTVDSCEACTDAQCRAFLDTKHFAHTEMEKRDAGALESLNAERSLRQARGEDLTAIDARIDNALNPDHPEPGIRRRNGAANYAELKSRHKVRVVKIPNG